MDADEFCEGVFKATSCLAAFLKAFIGANYPRETSSESWCLSHVQEISNQDPKQHNCWTMPLQDCNINSLIPA